MSAAEQSTGPFAPTPLGKDWTPPIRAAQDAPVEPATDVSLDDLFAGDENAGTGIPATEESPSGLEDLFAEVVPDPSQSPGPADNRAAGLDDLFEDLAGEDVTRTTTPGADTTPTVPAARPRVRRRGVPAALRTKNRVVTDEDADDPERDSTNAPGPSSVPAPPEDLRTKKAPTADVGPAPVRAVPETLSPASGPAEHVTQETEVGRTSLFARRPEEVERAWRIVDQTLAVVQADMSLQQVTSNITLTTDPSEYAAQRGEIHAALRRKMAGAGITPSGITDIDLVLDLVIDEISGISVLGELFRDPSVDEILVDRWDTVSVERQGHLQRTPISFRDPQHAESCARVLALKVSDRAVSRAIPLVTAELPSARVTFAFGAVVKGGLSITIRKFRPLLGLDDLLHYGSLNNAMVDFLREAVQARAGILVSGGTGTGKTTIVNLLSSFIPDTERVVSIEDAFELKLANTHVVSLQTKEASSLDDTVSVTLAELLRNTLRMRPDRIIVGEIREGTGAMVMLSAASTGHDGTLTTVHANSADGAVNERLPDLIRQSRGGLETNTILRSVVNAFDLVVQVGRTRDGRRYLSQIAALDGVDEDAGRIRLLPVFTGIPGAQGVRFERHELGTDTEIARRLARRKEN